MNAVPLYVDLVDTEKLPPGSPITTIYLKDTDVSFKCYCGCDKFLAFGNRYHCSLCNAIYEAT